MLNPTKTNIGYSYWDKNYFEINAGTTYSMKKIKLFIIKRQFVLYYV